MLRLSTALALTLAPLALHAQAPVVVADTVPVHSLVAQVMAGVAEPVLLLPPGTSPHDFQMRPSDAQALTGANVVIWTGESLAPWLAEPLATLAPDAVHLELLATDGWAPLPTREDVAFAHDHGHGEEAHAEEAHDDHAHGEEAHAQEAHDDHAHGEEDHADETHDDHAHEDEAHADEAHAEAAHDHDHAHDGADPHAWLSPAVATAWLGHIAETLATADPANADAYRANAATATAAIATLEADIAAQLAPVAGRAFIVPHDAYQYFEVTFDMPAAGAIALSDAAAPGPARIAELRDRVAAGDIACILTDPQTNPDWTAVLRENGIAATAEVDADGTRVTPGPDAYPTIMRNIADALTACLS
jgi:zinc transport system substrate-binding protein